jgi:hypothetical protein
MQKVDPFRLSSMIHLVYVAKRFVTYQMGTGDNSVAGIGNPGGLIAQKAEIFALRPPELPTPSITV